MTPQEFKDWREALGLTQQQAAELLGVTRRAVVKWEAGAAPISRAVFLACKYLAEHRPQPAAE